MPTVEMTLEEAAEEVSSRDGFAPRPEKSGPLVCEPWKEGSDPEMAADVDWLFDVLMV